MRYQYKMGGVFEDVVEGVIKQAKDIVDKRDKEKKDKLEQANKQGNKKPEEKANLIDTLTAPVKAAAKQQAKQDIAKWALIFFGLWFVLKGK